MIKIIAFDIDTLVNKNNIELDDTEKSLKKNIEISTSDSEYLNKSRKYIEKDSILMYTTENLINKLYEVTDPLIFKKIKEKYNDMKIVIITNHVTYFRNFIGENFDIDYLDDLIISSEIPSINTKSDLYSYVQKKYNIVDKEILFISSDDIKTKSNKLKINNKNNIYIKVIEYLGILN